MVSHLWPDLLRITLCPDQVILEQGKLIISLRGVEPRYQELEIIPVEPRHEPNLWMAPLAKLDSALEGLPDRPHDVQVILSNHFSHYPLVQVGSVASSSTPGEVIEKALRVALENQLARHDCRLTSLRSRIVALSAELRDELQGEPGWIVAVEDGLACLGVLQDSELTKVRNLYLWPASSVELLALLDREAIASGCVQPPRILMLWRRHESDEVTLSPRLDWQVIRLGDEQSSTSMPRLAVVSPPYHYSARA